MYTPKLTYLKLEFIYQTPDVLKTKETREDDLT